MAEAKYVTGKNFVRMNEESKQVFDDSYKVFEQDKSSFTDSVKRLVLNWTSRSIKTSRTEYLWNGSC